MAHGVRSRPRTAARARRCGAQLACTTLSTLLATGLGGCGNPEQEPSPRTVDVDRIEAQAIPAAVLDECHRPLRGRMHRLTATLTLADGSRVRAFAELPDHLRLVGARGMFLLRDGEVYRLDDRELAPADVSYVRTLRLLLDAAAFGPLHRSRDCARTDEGDFELRTDDGAAWRLRLRPDTLLPLALALGADEVRFDDYLRTTTTWVVKAATVADLGRVEVLFDDGGLAWREDFFAVPDRGAGRPRTGRSRDGDGGPRRQRVNAPGAVVESQSAVPIVVEQREVSWVVLRDPGDWPERAAAYAPVYSELERQQQMIAGFPPFWTEGGERWLAAPFRQRSGKPALTAPAGWQVRTFAAGRWLVVYPPAADDSDLEQRLDRGSKQLAEALQNRELQARGPVTAQPFVHLHEGAPTPAKLATVVLRMAVPIE